MSLSIGLFDSILLHLLGIPIPIPICPLLLLLLTIHIRMLDSQTPNIQIIANRRDDIINKTAIHAHTQPDRHEHKADLIHAAAQRTRPQAHQGSQAVQHGERKRDGEDVVEWEVGVFDEMGGDDGADGVGVDEADVEDERDEVVVEDDRLEVEVEGHEDPGCCVGE